MIPWDKLHGAMTHFPIALLLFSTACDFVSFTFKKLPFARGLRLVSFYGLAVWRLVVRDAMSRTGLCLYLILMLAASGFIAAAGYFGGEILLSGGGVP